MFWAPSTACILVSILNSNPNQSLRAVLELIQQFVGSKLSTFTPCNVITRLLSLQETLEDIDRNGDVHVDEDEYIGELWISEKGY